MCTCHTEYLLPLFHQKVYEAMSEASDAGEVKVISPDEAYRAIHTMDCPVNLLPEFRISAVQQFVSDGKGTQYLFALTESTEPGTPDPSVIILYSVEKGRRDTTTLSCRLLLVRGRTKIHAARALINHRMRDHRASRMEAQVTNHDFNADV